MRQHLHEFYVGQIIRIQRFLRQKKTNESFKYYLKSEKEKLGWNSNH